MATPPRKPGRKLTPRETLRAFHSPLHRLTTRRQVLGSFVATAAALGCSSSQSDPTAIDTGVAPTGSGQNGPAPSGTAPAVQPPAVQPPAVQPPAVQPPAVPTQPPATQTAAPTQPPATQTTEPSQPPATQTAEPTQPPATQTTEPSEPPATEPPATQTAPTQAPTVEVPGPEAGVPGTMGRSAYDLVELGSTGIVTSRLAMGSGTTGFDGSSAQTRMGEAFTQLLIDGYDRGIRFFETADAYGSHSRVRDAMQQVGRDNVTLLTKTMAETREEAEADLERFMEELGTDHLDIVLLHIRTSATWVADAEGAMEVLAEAKARGQIRAHGVSCHSLAALELAAQTDWVDVHLARINPFRLHMDSDPASIVSLLEGVKAAGKGVLGMKILAQGDAVDRFDEAIEYATRLECLHGFTIGFRSLDELEQVATKIASV
jgi:1-deoxyxylulose-5-phosphate synthase